MPLSRRSRCHDMPSCQAVTQQVSSCFQLSDCTSSSFFTRAMALCWRPACLLLQQLQPDCCKPWSPPNRIQHILTQPHRMSCHLPHFCPFRGPCPLPCLSPSPHPLSSTHMSTPCHPSDTLLHFQLCPALRPFPRPCLMSTGWSSGLCTTPWATRTPSCRSWGRAPALRSYSWAGKEVSGGREVGERWSQLVGCCGIDCCTSLFACQKATT